MEKQKGILECMCRICSIDLHDSGINIFSEDNMEHKISERISRYLYFTVLETDKLSKMMCDSCFKKLENIHLFAKMAAEMQKKFQKLLNTQDHPRPKIKIRSMEAINKDLTQKHVISKAAAEEKEYRVVNSIEKEIDQFQVDFEMNIDVAIEEVVGNDKEEEVTEVIVSKCEEPRLTYKRKKRNCKSKYKEANETDDTSDSDRLVIQDEEKPSHSLLQSLLLKGKIPPRTNDHDYTVTVTVKDEPNEFDEKEMKDEPPDPEEEDIAEEIAEDRLNQIIKDELESDSENENDMSDHSEIEITEMEVKVDPMLYFSNHSGNEIELDSQDDLENSNSSSSITVTTVTGSTTSLSTPGTTAVSFSLTEPPPLVMTRSQQKLNPVIQSLKLGKPYKCSVCPRSFITDIGLQNHLWSHLPKTKKYSPNSGHALKNVDMEDSQVYSSNGVLHTAAPSENPHLLKYVCPICGKKISTKGNLKVHLETHRPKGKYGCDICGRVFKTSANLYRHKDYHGGVQFPCPTCGRVYPTNSTLRAHSITHSDHRPHKCPLCCKTFKRNQDLKFHINQHTGARPYQCPYCPKAFASSGNCFSHRKRMHPIEVERDKERAAEIMG